MRTEETRRSLERVVEGELVLGDASARLVAYDSPGITPLPSALSDELNFKLGLVTRSPLGPVPHGSSCNASSPSDRASRATSRRRAWCVKKTT